jgi:hypothetical protein
MINHTFHLCYHCLATIVTIITMTMVASAPFAIAKAIEGLGRGVMDAELNDHGNDGCKTKGKR